MNIFASNKWKKNQTFILKQREYRQTYILNAFPIDSLASFFSFLANHNALQQGVHHRHSEGVLEGHNLHLQ